MGKPYSLDLRERIVRYVRQGHSARAAATVFGVAPSTAVRLAAADRDNAQIAPKRQGRAPGTVGKLAAHMDFLIERLQKNPENLQRPSRRKQVFLCNFLPFIGR